MIVSRRDVLCTLMKAMVVGASTQILGCLYGDISSPKLTVTDQLGSIDDNHDHVALLTKTQLTAGLPLTLDITGTSSHPHFMELSAEELIAIREGKPLSKATSNDWGHSHLVHFNVLDQSEFSPLM